MNAGGANPSRQYAALREYKPVLITATPGRLGKILLKQALLPRKLGRPGPAGKAGESRQQQGFTLVFEEVRGMDQRGSHTSDGLMAMFLPPLPRSPLRPTPPLAVWGRGACSRLLQPVLVDLLTLSCPVTDFFFAL